MSATGGKIISSVRRVPNYFLRKSKQNKASLFINYLFEELRESLDSKYLVGRAARFPATMHSEDGITHIDTPQRYRRSKDVS